MDRMSILSYNIEGLTLETNYCRDKTLKNYIVEKSAYFNRCLLEIDADIICLQEYSPVLGIDLDGYHCAKEKPCAFFFKKCYKYLGHSHHKKYGLVVKLERHGFAFWVASNRLPIGSERQKADYGRPGYFSRNKTIIHCIDTNMRKNEEYCPADLFDCYHSASTTEGHYTHDKKLNPYFRGDGGKEIRTRYDKIFHAPALVCKSLRVLRPENPGLVHDLYPFGGASDHYPLMAVFEINSHSKN